MQAMLRWLDPLLNPEACLPPVPIPAMAGETAEGLLKRLDLLLRKQVRYAVTGERRSMLKGQGLDFSGLREYTPGDDIRKMDWSVFARTFSPHIREYHEEKQLTLWLVVDLTPSMHFGRLQTKAQQAVELAGLMALLAQKANHKLGALLMLGAESQIIPPKAGQAQIQHLMQTLLAALEQPTEQSPASPGYDPLPEACRKLGHLVQKQHTVIFLSDFLAQTQAWQAPLGELARRAQLLCLLLADSVESALPSGLGVMTLLDPESGALVEADTNDIALRMAYTQAASAQQTERLHILRKMGAATVALTDADPVQALLALLAGTEAGRC
jgi:uncharacterized protein (DUF58 family)